MRKGEQVFFSLYKKLNPAQKKAVDTVEGPVMVIAGPGTGKTQILTLRIANILRLTDTEPEQILALTFTESGVFSMRKRLVEIIGSAGYRVCIHTFHGFANDLIKEYPDEFPKIIGAAHIHDVEKIALLQKLIGAHRGAHLRPFGDPFFYIGDIKTAISELKREYITPPRYKEIVHARKDTFLINPDLYHAAGAHQGKMKGKYALLLRRIERDEELAQIYTQYEKALLTERRYDYDDMIVEAVRALEENEELLRYLQETHQYILADEHQDANRSQNRILELLASFHPNPNLFIVGDEKQAIYRFQGASLENFLRFRRLYPEASVITLTENYRSTQPILDAAHAIASHGPAVAGQSPAVAGQSASGEETSAGGDARLVSKHPAMSKDMAPALAVFSRPELQCAYIAEDIKKKIAEGVPAEEIAVLYRTNDDAMPVADVFLKAGVPFVVESDQNVLRDPCIAKLLLLIRTVQSYGDDVLLARALHLDFLKLNNNDVYKIMRYAARRWVGLYDTLSGKKHLRNAGASDPKRLLSLAAMLSRWKTLGENTPPLAFLETLINESGFLKMLLAGNESVERLDKLNALFDDIITLVSGEKNYTLSDIVAYLDTLEEHGLPLLSRSRTARPGKVRLMTAHKAKGLEFDYVYVVDAHDGKWGNRRNVHYFTPAAEYATSAERGEPNDDERRLFYVALTRARLGATITYAREREEGKECLPAQFIEEMGGEHREERDTKAFEAGMEKHFFLMPPPAEKGPAVKDKTFLNSLFLEQGLSVTALNNYLKCPWNYFYNNLLRIPRAPAKHASFGTAAHAALKERADALAKGARFGKKAFIDSFLAALAKEPLSREDFDDCAKKGRELLANYFDSHRHERLKNLKTEMKIETLFQIPEVGAIPLRGMLDKVEFLENNAARVTDYKTGKIRSRNEIEGKTKNATGDYKRQLVFYKLLLGMFSAQVASSATRRRGGKNYDMSEGVIAFLEPDGRGRYREESFAITNEETEELKALIQKSAKEIYSLAFWNARCGDYSALLKAGKHCAYCELRDFLV